MPSPPEDQRPDSGSLRPPYESPGWGLGHWLAEQGHGRGESERMSERQRAQLIEAYAVAVRGGWKPVGAPEHAHPEWL